MEEQNRMEIRKDREVKLVLKEQYTYVSNLSDNIKESIKEYIKLNNYEEIFKDLELAFKHVPPITEPIILYRGIKDIGDSSNKSLRDLYNMNQTGSSNKSRSDLYNIGYISTTYIKEIAYNNFTGPYCCFLTIIVPSGSKVLPIEEISKVKSEKEILLDRNATFRITKCTQGSPKSGIIPFKFYDLIYVPSHSKIVTPNMSKEEQYIILQQIAQTLQIPLLPITPTTSQSQTGGKNSHRNQLRILQTEEMEKIHIILKDQYNYLENVNQDIKKSIVDYTMNSDINRTLWEGLPETKLEKKIKSSLDDELKKIPPITQPIIVYRGIKRDFISNRGYISTSYVKQVAIRFSELDCCLLTIILPVGSRILPIDILSDIPTEGEIILPRESNFLITNIRYIKGHIYIIKCYDLVYIPPDSQEITPNMLDINIKCQSNITFLYF